MPLLYFLLAVLSIGFDSNIAGSQRLLCDQLTSYYTANKLLGNGFNIIVQLL